MELGDLLMMLQLGSTTAAIVLVLNGLMQLAVRNKTGSWKEGERNCISWYHWCGCVDME